MVNTSLPEVQMHKLSNYFVMGNPQLIHATISHFHETCWDIIEADQKVFQ